MRKYVENLARALMNLPDQELSKTERRIIESMRGETPIAENFNEQFIRQTHSRRSHCPVDSDGNSGLSQYAVAESSSRKR